ILEDRLADGLALQVIFVEPEPTRSLVRHDPAMIAAENEAIDGAVVILGELAVDRMELFFGLVAIPDRPARPFIRDAGAHDALVVDIPVPNAVSRFLDHCRRAGRKIHALD